MGDRWLGFGDYGRGPFPDPRDATLDGYLAGVAAGGPAAFEAAAAELTPRDAQVLGAYTVRAAERAVRESRRDLLVPAALAFGLAGAATDDYRDTLLLGPTIDDAAQRLGVPPDEVFAEAAALAAGRGGEFLASWQRRTPDLRSLECMRIVAEDDGTGFRYRFAW